MEIYQDRDIIIKNAFNTIYHFSKLLNQLLQCLQCHVYLILSEIYFLQNISCRTFKLMTLIHFSCDIYEITISRQITYS